LSICVCFASSQVEEFERIQSSRRIADDRCEQRPEMGRKASDRRGLEEIRIIQPHPFEPGAFTQEQHQLET
jgi:hypothetical protein